HIQRTDPDAGFYLHLAPPTRLDLQPEFEQRDDLQENLQRLQTRQRPRPSRNTAIERSEEHTSELQSRVDLVCRLLLEKKKKPIKEENVTKPVLETEREKNETIDSNPKKFSPQDDFSETDIHMTMKPVMGVVATCIRST